MKKVYTGIFVFVCLFLQSVPAQTGSVNLVIPSGSQITYTSIGAAYAAIPTPLNGNYLIELSSTYSGATESYPIQLTDKGLAPGGNTITIRPAAGNNNFVIQRPTAATGAVIQFNGADNVILDGRPGGITSNSIFHLTVNDTYSGGSANRNIELINGANNNIIRYIHSFAAAATTDGGGSRNIAINSGSATAGGNNNNTITNCVVNGGFRGIQDAGLSAAVPNMGNIISNDSVRTFGAVGIFAGSNQTNITIQNNYVALDFYNVPVFGFNITVTGIAQQSMIAGTSTILSNTISLVSTSPTVSNIIAISDIGTGTENIIGNNITAVSTPTTGSTATNNNVIGISIGLASGGGVSTFNVFRNKISGLSSTGAAEIRGITALPGNGSTANVSNNFISIMDNNPNAAAIFGLYAGSPGGTNPHTFNTYYNTVRIGGSEGAASSASAYGIYQGDANTGSFYNQRNNISMMERTGGNNSAAFIAFYLISPTGTNTMNYNTYYATDATHGYTVRTVNGTLYRNGDLATYKTALAPQEQNSNFAPVTFVSATDLHLSPPSSTATSLYGTPITGIITDIDGNSRSNTNPFQGADEPNVVTPVQLFAFSGEGKDSYNTFHWQTATEQNNKGFYLQRSADGITFTSLKFIASKAVNGNATNTLTYTFDDVNPLINKGFYRLKQIDLDGKLTYSNIITITGKASLALSIASVYPNPVVNALYLIVRTPADFKTNLAIIDATGKVIIQQSAFFKTGNNYLSVNTSTLNSGIYTLFLKDLISSKTVTVRFVK